MARPRSDIKPRILHAARERFLYDGVEGASLRQIATEAGTNIGMIYYYFPTKDDLFLAVVEEVYEKLLADIEVALAPEQSVEARLHAIYSRIGRLSDDEFVVLRLIVREALVSSSRLDRIIERFARGHLPLVMRLVADGIAQGVFTSQVPPAVLFSTIAGVGLLPQVARRLVRDRAANPFSALPEGDGLVKHLVDVLLHGIGADPSVAPPPRPTLVVKKPT